MSVTRVLLALIFVSIGLQPQYTALTLLTFVAAMLTDVLDGVLARRLKCTSRAGEALDLLGDKFLTLASGLYGAALGMPLLACGLILLREIALTTARTIVVDRRALLPPSRLIGSLSILPTRIGTIMLIVDGGTGRYLTWSLGLFWIAAGVASTTLYWRIWRERRLILRAFLEDQMP